jgi:small-conductance mechanosensitive channel
VLSSRSLSLRFLTFLILFCAVSVLSAQATHPSSGAKPQPIDAAKIAFRSEELALKVRTILSQQIPEDTLAHTERTLQQQYMQLKSKAKETRWTLTANSTSLELHESEDQWRALSSSQDKLREELSGWSHAAFASMQVLNSEEDAWKATINAIGKDLGIKPLYDIAERALTDIAAAKKQIQRQIDRIVSLQEDAVSQSILVNQVKSEIADAERSFHTRLLARVAEPIWRRNPVHTGPPRELMSRSISRNSAMLLEFANLRRTILSAAAISFMLVLIFCYRVRHPHRTPPETNSPPSLLIAHPLAAAFTLQWPFALALARSGGTALMGILLMLSLIPTIRILAHDMPNRGRVLYVLTGFFAMGATLDIIPVDSPFRRALFLLFVAGGIAALAWILKQRGVRDWSFAGRAKGLARAAIIAGLVSMAIALGASVLGYTALAQFLRQAILLISYLAVLLVAWARVTSILVLALVRSRFVTSATLQSPGFEKWVPRFLSAAALLVWFMGTLDLLLLRGPFAELVDRIIGARLPGRLSEVSIGDLLSGILVLVGGLLLARAFRFFLREDVLSRFRFNRGIPELISNLAYYFALLVVFLASVKALGMDLSKLTLLTGAFGVGLGFGLQNIVNNFVSGLILEFERPIHTGDVIETAGQLGEVVRIGIRSTAMRTSQGAEVIVPNASLISGNVINWTSSTAYPDAKQRISVPVLVRAGADPGKVAEILVHTAEAQPKVLPQPEPSAYLKSSNPTSLLFELSFSTVPGASPEYVRNQVTVAAARAIREQEPACALAHP